jgi:CheY-like chemotaxis protein
LLPEKPRVAAEPTKPAAGEPKQQPDKGPKQGHTVLIVEDDPGFAETIVSLAGRHNFHGLVATSAEEAMELAYTRQPDAILLDLGLPDHSGLTVLDRIKEDPTMRHIPVHVISGMDFERQALGMGAMGYLLKPVKKEQLESAFGSLQKTLSQTMKSVLIVEDDAVQRESIAKLLSDGDVEVEAVATGREAIGLLGKRTYDCMIMDLSLGDMTGFDLLEELTASEHSFPPTIVYTGRDLTRDEESRLRKYSESIIIKGARSPERLLNETSLFLHRVESKMAPDRRQMLHELRHREKTFANRTILLVDDDARNIFALTSVLERKGAKVVFARNGIEAIDKLHSDPSVELILMDMMMPEMDGYEATRRIRREKRYADLPIIAVTARAMKDDQVRCLEAGANDFLSKPVDTEKLMSLMRVWLPKHGWMNA